MNIYNPFDDLKNDLNEKKKLLKNKKNKAKIFNNKSKNPSKTNIISSNFRNENILGYQSIDDNNSYITQFELSKIYDDIPNHNSDNNNNSEFSTYNNDFDLDDNLTHNNMVPFNKWRDKQYNNQNCDNNQVVIDRYSGSSRFYFQKKEIEPFFEPSESATIQYNPNLINEMDRTRYIPSYLKQGEKPFEPTKINKGLNLKYNELGKGGLNDNYRPNLKNIDELRPLNKPKLSYSGFIIEGKKGEKRGNIAIPNKYRPVTFKENKTTDLIPNSGINKEQVKPNYNLKKQRRKSNVTSFGNIKKSQGTNNNKLLGTTNKYDRKLSNLEQQGNITNNNVFNPNNKSYTIFDNQRNLTKQELNTFINTISTSYSKLNPEIKQTLRNILSNYQFNTNISSIQKQNISNLPDLARNTLKQILVLNELNTNIKNNNGIYSNLTDIAKNTLKETLTEKQLQTNIQGNNTTYSNLTDTTKNTLRELLSLIPINTNIQGNNTTYSNLNDIPKETLKQLLTEKQFNTNLQTNNTTYSNLNDKAKETLKQLLTEKQLNTNIQNINTTYSNLTNEAKETLKQLSLIKDYIYLTGNKNGLYNNTFNNPDLNLRNLSNIEYTGPIGFNIENIKHLENVILNEIKTIEGRTFNLSGPTINNNTPADNIDLKNEYNFSRLENGLLKGNNLNDRNIFNNYEYKTINKLDEDYNKLKTINYNILDNNPLINSLNIKSNNLNHPLTNDFLNNILGKKYN